MQRRNFILGLGAAATLSGAASVTGAAFADSVSASGADFRVITEASINANGIANESGGGENDTTETFVNETGGTPPGIQFGDITPSDTGDLPVVYSNDEGEDLVAELAFANETSAYEATDGVIQLENTGDADVDVEILFTDNDGNTGFGGDVDGSDLTPSDVVSSIEFHASDAGTGQISPNDVNDDNTPNEGAQAPNVPETLTVAAGETENVEIHVDTSNSFETGVEAVATGGDAFSGGTSNLNLVDNITIGTPE